MKLRIIISTIAFLALVSILLGSVIFFNSLIVKRDNEATFRADELVRDISSGIYLHISEHLGNLDFISREEEFFDALKIGTAAHISEANERLDRLQSSLKVMDVCYLIDRNGNTIASSNRRDPDSFIGKNYSFRPYFKEAFSGVPSVYMGLGVTTNKRGLYYAYPVYGNKDQDPSGVIVLKESMGHLETMINRPYEGVLMITDPNGIVFLSNREDWLLKTLWPVTPQQVLKIKESKQFGEGPWEAVGLRRTEEYHAVDPAGKGYHIHKGELSGMPGWQVVYLHDHAKMHAGLSGYVIKRSGFLFIAVSIFFSIFIFYLLKMAAGDLSNRKKAELHLLKERNQAQQYLDIAGVMFAILNTKGEVALINKKGCEILGYDEKEILNKNWFDLCIREDMREKIWGVFNKLMSGEVAPVEYYENTVITRTGKEKIIAFHNSIIKDEVGNIAGVLFSGEDVTERNQALEDLKMREESFKLYQALINQSNDAIEVLDPETGSFLNANEKACTDLGYTREEFLSLKVFDIDPMVKPSDFPKIIEDLKSTVSGIWNGVHLRKDGSTFPVEVSLKFVQLDRSYLVSVARDVTDRKRIEEELKLLNEQIKERNRELQQIVYAVSHDLRSPLINIQGYSRMLVKYIEKVVSVFMEESVTKASREEVVSIVDKDIPESVSYMLSSVKKMDSLLSALLKLSRSTRVELNMEDLDMNMLVSDVLNTFDFQMKEAGARAEISPLPSCSGDASQINQVFSNLIGNAIQYSSPERHLILNISGREEKGQAVYCVEDNGIGIPSQEQGKIFDIFYRIDPEGSMGEGIGLTIVSKIIERHGGRIWVESEFGEGSKFYVALPRKTGAKV